MNKKELHRCIGWLGVAFGLLVAPMQLIKIVQTGEVGGISLFTLPVFCAWRWSVISLNAIKSKVQCLSRHKP
jgi:uncharacterized protein with PQ loop repeat